MDNLSYHLGNIRLLKEEASKMNNADRKSLAEKVVLSFWNAINGDMSELEDLDKDSPEEFPSYTNSSD